MPFQKAGGTCRSEGAFVYWKVVGLSKYPLESWDNYYLFFFPTHQLLFMAMKQAIRPLLRLNALQTASSSSNVSARRTLSTFSQLQLSRALIKPSFPRSTFQQSFRRSYADVSAPKPKRRIRTTLRWLWRFTYLGVIGFLGYTGYTIYLLRTPSEQEEADPSKKTLVILGMCPSIGIVEYLLTKIGTGWGAVSLLKKLDTEVWPLRMAN